MASILEVKALLLERRQMSARDVGYHFRISEAMAEMMLDKLVDKGVLKTVAPSASACGGKCGCCCGGDEKASKIYRALV